MVKDAVSNDEWFKQFGTCQYNYESVLDSNDFSIMVCLFGDDMNKHKELSFQVSGCGAR